MLNPNKKDQAGLRVSLQEAQSFLLACFTQMNKGNVSFDDKQYAAIKQKAFNAITSIGIVTWTRIKKLE
jgi:hypothetical protein